MTASVEELTRRIAGRIFLEGWHGVSGAERLHSASAVAGVSFDPKLAADTAPYTPQEVLTQVGFVRMQVDEINAGGDGVSAGELAGAIVSGEETLLNLQFAMRIPLEADQSLFETYAAALRALYVGIYVEHAGPPWFTLRNLPTRDSFRRRDLAGRDVGPWRLSYLDVKLLRRTRNAHRGAQEVAP
jgi:hypothetical protein